MKLVRDKIPEVIFFNGQMACLHIADDQEYSTLLRQKLQEEVDEFLASGATEELADILEVLYALAAVLGVSERGLEQLRNAKADARGRFMLRIVWHGSRPRSALTSQAVAARTMGPPVARPIEPVEPTHEMSLFDSSQVVPPIVRASDSGRRRRSFPQTARGEGEVDKRGRQLQLSLEISSR